MGHTGRGGKKGNECRVLEGKRRKTGSLEYLDAEGRIILKQILRKG
jgi:hypothetical protein